MLAVAGLVGLSFGRLVFSNNPCVGKTGGKVSEKFFSDSRCVVSMVVGGRVNSLLGESERARLMSAMNDIFFFSAKLMLI